MKPKPKPKSKSKPESQLKLVKKSFRAPLERLRSNLGWVVIWIPFDVFKVWGCRGRLKIRGEINGFAFRTSLFPTRTGDHFLLVNKKMQAGAGAKEGSRAEIVLEPDTEERFVIIPGEFNQFLAEDRAFRRWFVALNCSIRKWIGDGIVYADSPAVRARRAEQGGVVRFVAVVVE